MHSQFQPGFRLSAFDIVVLVVGTAASLASVQIAWEMAAGIACVVLHFFLFCNVFRIPRPQELIWAAGFVGLATLSTLQVVPWFVAFAASIALSTTLIVFEMRKPNYHGLFWKSLNPNLEDYFMNAHVPTISTDGYPFIMEK